MADKFMQVSPEDFATKVLQEEIAEEEFQNWRSSPASLLAKLQNPNIDRTELFDAVLFAEIASFNADQTAILVPLLLSFVAKHRFSHEDNVKTVVGAAIRKTAMNLTDGQIEDYADLFLPTDTDTLPCEIELELAKAILWRLAGNPATILANQFPKLDSCLSGLASDYLRPRLILQENYASVALHAIQGVVLINGQHADKLLKTAVSLNFDWFTDLLQRRLVGDSDGENNTSTPPSE